MSVHCCARCVEAVFAAGCVFDRAMTGGISQSVAVAWQGWGIVESVPERAGIGFVVVE